MLAALAHQEPASAQRGAAPPRPPEPVPAALTAMVEAERAFAMRALEVGWKQAFLDFFSESAIGYDGEEVGYAKEQIRRNPDPPKDHQLLWEPRYGDVARSGELGYLTGPSRNILPSRNNGQPRHGVYASVWKRERDGTFRVVMDLGTNTPRAATFAEGFTRAPSANRFAGELDERTPPLGTADSVLNSDLKTGASRAYRGRLAPGVRFHRQQTMPVVGEAAVMRYLATQPRYEQVDSRYAESAQSGDLGYTWGTWSRPLPSPRGRASTRGSTPGPAGKPNTGGASSAAAGAATGAAPAGTGRFETGVYMRVWVRERAGQWKVVLDVLN
jgi:ketosteroid isomerase-like protein